MFGRKRRDEPFEFTQAEINDMFLLSAEAMTIVREARDEELSIEQRVQLMRQWTTALSDINSPAHLHLFIWCSLSLSTACIDGLTSAISGVQLGTVSALSESLGISDEVTASILESIPSIEDHVNFQTIMQQTVYQLAVQNQELPD